MTVFCRQPCDESVLRCRAAEQPCTARTGALVLAATVIGSSMAFIDGTVVNVALPTIQQDLDASVASLQWIVESYALLLSALILVGGAMGDRYGRKRIFAVGIGIFALASAWCGLAPDTEQLILARAVKGVGAALLVPGSLALITATFSIEQRGRAIGTWSALTALAMAFGPVLGGWLVDNVSWRWIFFINLPLAAAVLLILRLGVPESRDDASDGPLDWRGASYATFGLGAFVFGLIEAGPRGLDDPLVLGALAFSLPLLALFVRCQRRGKAPMMPPVLFRSIPFSGANLITLLLYAALGGALFFFPFSLVQLHGYSATEAGAAFLPLVLIMFGLSRWSGGLVDRFGGKLPLTVGPIIAAVGFSLFALPGLEGSYWTTFFPAVVVLGLGLAISVPPLTTVVLGAVDDRYAGVASGVNNAVARTAGLLAIALMGLLMDAVFNESLDFDIISLSLPEDARAALDAERVKLAAAMPPPGLSDGLRAAVDLAIRNAFLLGFQIVMLLAAALSLLSACIALLTIGGKPAAVAEPTGAAAS